MCKTEGKGKYGNSRNFNTDAVTDADGHGNQKSKF